MQDDWHRRHFTPGGGDAFLFFVVFGQASQPLDIKSSTYRVSGLPPGIDLRSHGPAVAADLLAPPFAQRLASELGSTTDELTADGCLILRGSVADPPDLLYLRECVGVVMALLDQGLRVAYSPQTMRMDTADSWRARLFEDDRPYPRHHVTILQSDEPDRSADGRLWVHTRGMRQFGRPDVSVCNVPRHGLDGAVEVCNRFIEHMAFGMVVPEGQTVTIDGLPSGMRCRHGGHLDDPDFNNVHIELAWPPTV